MRGFVDLHCHWIAGIDDGPRTATASLAMLKGLREAGFDTVMATPHMRPGMFDNDRAMLLAAFEAMQPHLAGIPGLPAVLVSSEHFFDDVVFTRLVQAVAMPFARAHRGVFVVEDVDRAGAHLVDLWSGAELLVRHLDEAQATTLTHAEGAMDARVVADASADSAALYVLPGALHHGPDALEPISEVLAAARDRDMATGDVLDALLRMELVFRSSSRVKAGFAYRTSALPAAGAR